jgi:lambda family phage portal protein
MANLIDRLVGIVNPDAGLRRFRSRALLARAYEGASTKDGWRPRRPGASANTDHMADARTLRIRARSLVQNSPYIARGIGSLVANTVSTGIKPRSLAVNAAAIDALWNEWTSVADADDRLDFYGLEAAAYRAMEVDGEVLVRLRSRRPEDGLPVPLQVQLLEIDWLDSSRNGAVGPNTIINGIEFDPLGKRVNYWLWDQHPGEQYAIFKRRSTSYPVPADRIIHLFNPERPGQGRGFSRLAPVIARVRDLTLYEDAELQRKNLETRLSVIASGDVAAMSMSETQSAEEVKKTGELGTLASGSITQVPSGTNITLVEPKVAPGYVEYVKHNLHIIAAGMGVTYEMLTGDVKEVNFSSARVSMLEFRRNAEQFQELTLIPRLCAPIWRAFIDAAVLGGKLRRADYSVDWATPKWDYVNPEQDVKADLAEISGGLSTISEKLRRRGYKPDLIFQELKSDFERLKKDGTFEFLLMLQTKQILQEDSISVVRNAGLPTQKPNKEILDLIMANAMQAKDDEERRHQRNIDLIHSLFSRQADRTSNTESAPLVVHNHIEMPEQRAVENHIHVPETTVNIEATMPSPVVEVRNEITTPQPTVNVTNEVKPAAVDVSVRATLPARVSETTVERDALKNITRSITTERDA